MAKILVFTSPRRDILYLKRTLKPAMLHLQRVFAIDMHTRVYAAGHARAPDIYAKRDRFLTPALSI